MSRSNPTQAVLPLKQVRKRAPAPTTDNQGRPLIVTVNGSGLAEWCARSHEVHVYRMVTTRNGTYTLSLLWLDGRALQRFGDSNAVKPKPGRKELILAGGGAPAQL